MVKHLTQEEAKALYDQGIPSWTFGRWGSTPKPASLVIPLNAFTEAYKRIALISQHNSIDWKVVLSLVLVGLLGSLLGARVSLLVPQARLRQGFALFLVGMGAYIVVRNL